jgi:hypothetical protein
VLIDASQHIRIAHRARLYQVHTSPKQLLEGCLGGKQSIQAGLNIRRKLDQKVRIAAVREEVNRTRCGAEYFQAANAKALTDGGYACVVLSDGGMHLQILGWRNLLSRPAANASSERLQHIHRIHAHRVDCVAALEYKNRRQAGAVQALADAQVVSGPQRKA